MASQKFARFFDRFHQRVGKILVLEMGAHPLHQLLPEFIPALLMDAFVSDHGELACARQHKNKNAVSLLRRLHAQLMELLLRLDQRIASQFAPLHINANLSGRFRFGLSDRADDAIVLESG